MLKCLNAETPSYLSPLKLKGEGTMPMYAVISDIHGNPETLKTALLTAKNKKADWVLLLGDLLNHGPRNGLPATYDPMQISEIVNEIAPFTVAVKGNCDSEVDEMLIKLPINSVSNTIIIGGHKAFMTHGHRFKPEQAAAYGLSAGDIFMSGHTHQAVLEVDANGIVILNPGSITFPKSAKNIACLKNNPQKTMPFINEEKIYLTTIEGEELASLNLER